MALLLRLLGSTGFVIGLFTIVFVGLPWVVTVVNNPDIGGPLPFWFKLAVYLVLGGVLVVLASIGLEQAFASREAEPPEVPEGTATVMVQNASVVPGREVTEVLGLVQGHTIYAIWIGKDISALVRLVLGGELTEYTEMMGKARALALRRMTAEAEELGADVVLEVRMTTTSVVGTAAELLAYGTAVKLTPAATA